MAGEGVLLRGGGPREAEVWLVGVSISRLNVLAAEEEEEAEVGLEETQGGTGLREDLLEFPGGIRRGETLGDSGSHGTRENTGRLREAFRG